MSQNASKNEREKALRSPGKNKRLETEIRKIIDSLDDQTRKEDGGNDVESLAMKMKPKNDIVVTEIRNTKDKYYSRTTVMSESEETITEVTEGKTSEMRITSGRIEKPVAEQTSTSYPPNGSTMTTEGSNVEERRLKNKRKRTICFCTNSNQQDIVVAPEVESAKKKRLEDTNSPTTTYTEPPSSEDKSVTRPKTMMPPPFSCSCLHGRIPAPTRGYHPDYYTSQAHSWAQSKQEVFERVDRYNENHISLRAKPEQQKKRSWYEILFNGRYNVKNRSDDSCSTIPQLYKARVGRGGLTPEKFTFKAVLGDNSTIRQHSTEHCPSRLTSSPPPLPPPIPPRREDSRKSVHPTTNCHCHVPEPSYQSPYVRDCRDYNGHHDREDLRQPLISEENEVVANRTKTKAFFSGLGGGYVSCNSVPEKVDVYCFDQLNTGFFRTSDHPPPLLSDIAIQRTETQAARFWAEIYGFIHIILAFILAFILQTFKFILQAIVRPLLIGFVQIFADYLFKPLLTLVYNGLTQPISVFLYNVLSSLRDVLQPVAKTLGYFVDLVTSLLRSIRLVEVKQSSNITPYGQVSAAGCPVKPV